MTPDNAFLADIIANPDETVLAPTPVHASLSVGVLRVRPQG